MQVIKNGTKEQQLFKKFVLCLSYEGYALVYLAALIYDT